MSRLRRPFSYGRDLFVTMDGRAKYAGVNVAEQESSCGREISDAKKRPSAPARHDHRETGPWH